MLSVTECVETNILRLKVYLLRNIPIRLQYIFRKVLVGLERITKKLLEHKLLFFFFLFFSLGLIYVSQNKLFIF